MQTLDDAIVGLLIKNYQLDKQITELAENNPFMDVESFADALDVDLMVLILDLLEVPQDNSTTHSDYTEEGKLVFHPGYFCRDWYYSAINLKTGTEKEAREVIQTIREALEEDKNV